MHEGGKQLVTVEIEINPSLGAPPFLAPQNSSVEFASFGQVSDRYGQMKGCKGELAHLNQLKVRLVVLSQGTLCYFAGPLP